MTVVAPVFSVTVGALTVPIVGGDVSLDATRSPHVQGRVQTRFSASLAASLDPRQSPPPRVVVTVTDGLPRTFDLTLRGRPVEHRAGLMTLSLASDEALLSDWAPLADDTTPYDLRTSLRSIVNYALGAVIPGASLAASPATDVDVTPYWTLTNLFPDPYTENPTPAIIPDISAPNVVRDGSTYAPPLVGAYLYRVQSTGTGSLSVGQRDASGVREGTAYTASAYLRSYSGNTKQARLVMRWTGAAGQFIGDVYGDYQMTSATAWVRRSITAQAPAGATGLRLFIDWQGPHASGNLHFISGIMIHEGRLLVPLFSGGTPADARYTYKWAADAAASPSTRTTVQDSPSPDALIWPAGTSAMDFLRPLLQAQGLRLVCDETRTWTLRDASFSAAGQVVIRDGVNLVDATDTIDRDAGVWFDARATRYRWRDRDGIQRERVDSYALNTPYSRLTRLDIDAAYPGPGRSQYAVQRAQGAGREVEATTMADWSVRAEQAAQIMLPGTALQYGAITSVVYDLGKNEMTARARTVDLGAHSINALTGTINALTGTINGL